MGFLPLAYELQSCRNRKNFTDFEDFSTPSEGQPTCQAGTQLSKAGSVALLQGQQLTGATHLHQD